MAEKDGCQGELGVDPDLELHLGLAVYLSTYADFNLSTREYVAGLTNEPVR